MVVVLIAAAVAVWEYISGLPAPVLAVLLLAVVAFVIVAWRAFAIGDIGQVRDHQDDSGSGGLTMTGQRARLTFEDESKYPEGQEERAVWRKLMLSKFLEAQNELELMLCSYPRSGAEVVRRSKIDPECL